MLGVWEKVCVCLCVLLLNNYNIDINKEFLISNREVFYERKKKKNKFGVEFYVGVV